jgi:DNA-directed RNA polymerase subunit RPC12/RpoP
MSSKNQTTGNMPMNCDDCNAPVRKTASEMFVCTGCGHRSEAQWVR